MRDGLPKLLKDHLRTSGEWIAKNDLCRLVLKTPKGGTYGADLISRKLRNLEEASILAVKYENGHGFYKYIPDYLRLLYIPTSVREMKMWSDQSEVNRLLAMYSK